MSKKGNKITFEFSVDNISNVKELLMAFSIYVANSNGRKSIDDLIINFEKEHLLKTK